MTELADFKNAISIIFDLDGVLADTEPLRYLSYRCLFLEKFLVELPVTPPSEIVGRSEDENLSYFLNSFKLKGNLSELRKRRAFILTEIIGLGLRPPRGLHSLLNELQKRRIKLGVATNSSRDYAHKVLKILNVEKYFSVVITEDDIDICKPHPEIYSTTAKTLDCNPNTCVAVEDSPAGIMAAKRAGMRCIAITSSFSADQLKIADYIVNDLQSVAKIDLYNDVKL